MSAGREGGPDAVEENDGTADHGRSDIVEPDEPDGDPAPDEAVCCDLDAEGEEPAPSCPIVCLAVPPGGEVGAPCSSDSSCAEDNYCHAESVETFEGETYVTNPGGQCVYEAYPCDRIDPSTCPPGSQLIPADMGRCLCVDACEPADSSGNPYNDNCGCRDGYRCDLAGGFCWSGCSNDRECCERWWDVYPANSQREEDEVVLKEGCTNVCDSAPRGPCGATYACINNGDPTNRWGGPCEGDAWCPPDGRCLIDLSYLTVDCDPIPCESRYPGGYCIKEACNLVGRGCSESGGACAKMQSIWIDQYLATAPAAYACVGRCHFGRHPGDPD